MGWIKNSKNIIEDIVFIGKEFKKFRRRKYIKKTDRHLSGKWLGKATYIIACEKIPKEKIPFKKIVTEENLKQKTNKNKDEVVCWPESINLSPYHPSIDHGFDIIPIKTPKEILPTKEHDFICKFNQKGNIITGDITRRKIRFGNKSNIDSDECAEYIVQNDSTVYIVEGEFLEGDCINLFIKINAEIENPSTINYAVATLQWPRQGKELFGGFIGRGTGGDRMIIGTLIMKQEIK